MKHIVIDARLYGSKHTGIGRYTKNLLKSLSQLPNFNKYKFTLIVYRDLKKEIIKDLGTSFNYCETDIKHYSLKEQLVLPFIIYRLNADLVHFTHFNKPLFYFKKSVVTIHDLIKHFSRGKETTTQNQFFYQIKYFFYLILVNLTVKTNQIIVPSNYWRDFLIKKYHLSKKRVVTTYEAVDSFFLKEDKNKNTISKASNYLIYTGNLYPHKNIEVLLLALKKLPHLKLKIISARNYFTQKISKKINELKLQKQVEILGYIDDHQFIKIYKNALALVHPSLMEGFSLTGLEAMALNCPVISSTSSCLPEIYGNSVLYFDPYSPDDLIKKINQLKKSSTLRQKLLKLGHQQVKKYSWDTCAKESMAVYQKLL